MFKEAPLKAANRSPAVFKLDRKSELKAFEKKGFIANYLTALTTKQLVDNTLTGFLINLIRKKGNVMSLADILAFTENRFDTLRKPNGKAYTSKSKKKSIICALSSNGVFDRMEKQVGEGVSNAEEEKDELTDARVGSSELWQVNEEEARKFNDEMVAKFEMQKSKLGNRKRKYTGDEIL